MHKDVIRAGGTHHIPGGKTGYLFRSTVPVGYNPVSISQIEPVMKVPDNSLIGIGLKFCYILHARIINEEGEKFYVRISSIFQEFS